MDKMITVKVRKEVATRRYLTDPTDIANYRKKVLKRMAVNAKASLIEFLAIGVVACVAFGIAFGFLALGMTGLEYILSNAFVNV